MSLFRSVARFAHTLGSNCVNIVVFIFTGGTRTTHEGGTMLGTWSNWNGMQRVRPKHFVLPTTEVEICAAVKKATKIRVVGGGHSFNDSALSPDTMLSLDAYNKVISVDKKTGVVRVQAGIRLRDFQKELKKNGLALPAAGSTDVQSLGGLSATDVHGTGRDHAFLSEIVESVRVVNADGVAQTVTRSDELFHAVLGGVGVLGVVTELTLRCVPHYNLKKSIEIIPIEQAERDIEKILGDHDHASFYYLGGVRSTNCRLNTWDNTTQPISSFLRLRKIFLELVDMFFSAFILGAARVFHKLDITARFGFWLFSTLLHGHSSVHSATSGFARRLFYRHEEIEYGVPYEKYKECLDEVQQFLLDNKYFAIIEVRFSPNRSAGLLSPGAGRRTCYIELAPSLSWDTDAMCAAVEKIFWKYDGHAHLGKFTRATATDLERMYGERYQTFKRLRALQDPTGKFLNAFGERLFGMRSNSVKVVIPAQAGISPS